MNKELAQQVAYFLEWTGWLDEYEQDNIYSICLHCKDGTVKHCGTKHFERLKEALDQELEKS